MDALVVLIPLIPLLAAIIIGLAHLLGAVKGEAGEGITALTATWAISMSCLLALTLLVAHVLKKNIGLFELGQWLTSDRLSLNINFITTGFNSQLAALFAVLLAIVTKFSVNYMHREPGYHRFFFILSLFSSAILLLVLSGNAVGTFIGWEIAGLCSYLLIAYAYDRPNAAVNATRVFITNRIGDAAFVLGIGLSYLWADTINWSGLNAAAEDLTRGEATTIALCFSIAAMAKSAQLPFSPWLARSMEGPTPSSAIFYGAVMIHAGVYLLILLQPLLDKAPFISALLVTTGLATALYSYFAGLTQTDIKSSQAFATTGQLGLMFLECGFGFWQLASWHLCAHAVVRCYSILTAPSIMYNVKDIPVKPAPVIFSKSRWLFIASLQRFWVEQITDWALVKPVRRLAHDLSYVDDRILDKLMGVPATAINTISSLAKLEEHAVGARLEEKTSETNNNVTRGTGLVSSLASGVTVLVHWVEERLVLQGIGFGTIHVGRTLGHLANKFETQFLRPRYLVLLVVLTLLVAF